MRGGDDGAEGVERGAAKEDIIRCGCVNDEEADMDGLSLGSITEDGAEVNVAACGNLFSRKNHKLVSHMGPWLCLGVEVSDMLPSRGCRQNCLGRQELF